MHNIEDRHRMNAEVVSDGLLRHAGSELRANLPHLVCGQARKGVRVAMTDAVFRSHISVVIRDGTEKQMVRADAGAHVTTVQNRLAFGYVSVMNYPGCAMHLESLTTQNNGPISLHFFHTLPKPAGVSLLHFRPEAGGEVSLPVLVKTGLRTEVDPTAPYSATFLKIGLSAFLADEFAPCVIRCVMTSLTAKLAFALKNFKARYAEKTAAVLASLLKEIRMADKHDRPPERFVLSRGAAVSQALLPLAAL
jgi:hypothetical protein